MSQEVFRVRHDPRLHHHSLRPPHHRSLRRRNLRPHRHTEIIITATFLTMKLIFKSNWSTNDMKTTKIYHRLYQSVFFGILNYKL